MGGSKSDQKMEVVDYLMSVHFALCHGPVDAIHQIVVKEKEAWRGRQTVQGPINVSAGNLFGGNKKEGGVAGRVEFLPGNFDQVIPDYIASRFGRTSTTMPAYRGIATAFFSDGGSGGSGRNPWGSGLFGQGGSNAVLPGPQGPLTGRESYGFDDIPLDRPGGFYWSSNNPYLPDTWIKVSRAPKTMLPAALAAIPNLVPEAIIGKPEEPEEDEDDEGPSIPANAENEDPLNGYFIGALPTEETFVKTQFGYRGTVDSLTNDPTFLRRVYSNAEAEQRGYDGLVYRNYGDDANPMHMIVEALMDTDWGMGAPETSIDYASALDVAQRLVAEKFGLTIGWFQQSNIESIVTEILDHIQMTAYIHPRTGLWTFKLIRGDYDSATLRVMSPDNANLRSFQRKAWGETVNEITVTWTNPENEKESTVTLQDLGNIAMQGSVVADNRNYYGIRNAALAMQVCARDLRTASAPTASLEADLDRTAWDILPGEVVRIWWPEEGLENVVFRVMDVDYGRIGAPDIKVKFVEDIFALPTQGYTITAPPSPAPTEGFPEPLDHVSLFTMPYQLAARFDAVEGSEYPDAGVLFLGASLNGSIDGFVVESDVVLPTGGATKAEIGSFGVTTHVLLPQGLPHELVSTVAVFSARTRDGGLPAPGGLLIIGNREVEHEIAMFSAFDPVAGYTFQRGMLDTVPRAWPANTPAWIIEFDVFKGLDQTRRPADVEIVYDLRPMTDKDILPRDEAQPVRFTPSERPYLPTRPANVMVGGQRFERKFTTRPGSVPVTWANRNRLMEDSVFRPWTDGNVTPEEGQTTVIRVFDELNMLVAEHTDLTGTSFDLPTVDLLGGRMRVQFLSSRDGFVSLQGASVFLEIPFRESGYGAIYGFAYGGTGD